MSNLGVVGSPIGHSKSPLLHKAAFHALGLDWHYDKFLVGAGQLQHFVDSRDTSWRGLSVTMPHKTDAFELSGSHDAHATYTGAVNTLAFSYNSNVRSIRGYNTDVFGIVQSLSAATFTDRTHAVVLGGGSTALSALVALSELHFAHVTVVLRDISKSQPLIALAAVLGVHLAVVNFGALESVPDCSVCVSTIPGSAGIELDGLARFKDALLLDAAYDVWPSPRALAWSSRGGRSVSGLSMLAFQALKQVRIFVADAPDSPLPHETKIAQAMFSAVGLGPSGI